MGYIAFDLLFFVPRDPSSSVYWNLNSCVLFSEFFPFFMNTSLCNFVYWILLSVFRFQYFSPFCEHQSCVISGPLILCWNLTRNDKPCLPRRKSSLSRWQILWCRPDPIFLCEILYGTVSVVFTLHLHFWPKLHGLENRS